MGWLLALVLATTIPFSLVNNHVYVDVTLDGKGPYHFIFDSGGANVMDPQVAGEIGAPVHGRGRISGVGNTVERVRFATVRTLKIGDATLDDQRFVVTPARNAFGAAEGPPVDGLIGAEVLNRFVTTIDYARREVTLREADDAAFGEGAAILPLSFRGGLPQIPCRIDDIPGACNVDTGSRLSVTVLQGFIAAHPSVVPLRLSAPGVDGYGIGGAAYGRLGRISSLAFGPYTILRPVADFSTQQRGAFSDRTTAANIGGGIWRRFALTFDYPHNRLALRPNALFDQPDSYDRSGLFIIVRHGNIVALDVRAHTPASDADLRPGDRLVEVEGEVPTANALPHIRALLAGTPGTALRMRVQRGPEPPRDVTLILRDYV